MAVRLQGSFRTRVMKRRRDPYWRMGQMSMHRVRVMQPSPLPPWKPLQGVVVICNRAGCCWIKEQLPIKRQMDAGFGVWRCKSTENWYAMLWSRSLSLVCSQSLFLWRRTLSQPPLMCRNVRHARFSACCFVLAAFSRQHRRNPPRLLNEGLRRRERWTLKDDGKMRGKFRRSCSIVMRQ